MIVCYNIIFNLLKLHFIQLEIQFSIFLAKFTN